VSHSRFNQCRVCVHQRRQNEI